MKRNGIIIRLIDVCLIILLGFLAISDFQKKTPISLPNVTPEDEVASQPDEDTPIALVRIDKDRSFYLSVDDSDTLRLTSKSELESSIYSFYSRDTSMVVLIMPHDSSDVQSTVDVIDICEKYNIPRNLGF